MFWRNKKKINFLCLPILDTLRKSLLNKGLNLILLYKKTSLDIVHTPADFLLIPNLVKIEKQDCSFRICFLCYPGLVITVKPAGCSFDGNFANFDRPQHWHLTDSLSRASCNPHEQVAIAFAPFPNII